MAETFSNTNMESLLTMLTERVKDIRSQEDLHKSGDRLNLLITDLEDVTSELKSCKSDWKTATQQVEDGAKQIAEKNEELDEREMKMKKEEEQLARRTLELEANERLVEERRVELEKKEKLLQQQSTDLKQQSADLQQTERIIKDEQASLQDQAASIESTKSEVLQAQINLEARTNAAENAEKANNRRSNGLRQREATLKLILGSAVALNENVNNNLTAMRNEVDEDKKVRAAILEKHRRMKQLRANLVQMMESCTTKFNIIQASRQQLVNFENDEREILAGLNEDINSLSTALTKQAEDAKGISKEIEVAEKDLEMLVTSTERQLGRISTNIGNVTKVSTELDQVSSKIGNVTEVSTELDEVSVKIQQFQPTMIDTLRELTEALSKAQAAASKAEADAAKARADAAKAEDDAAKARADSRRTLVDHSVSRFEESLAKRGLGPTSPEKPISKRRRHARQSSVGSAEMLTNLGRPEPLPENILSTIRSPRGQGRVTMVVNRRREDDSSSPIRRPVAATRTPSGGHGLLRSSIGSQNALHSQPSSLIDPATATGERSSQSAMIPSSQSGVSATDLPILSEASDEVKHVWRQIDFPMDWDMEASKSLLVGFNKHLAKRVPPKLRPAGLMDGSCIRPNCLLRRLQKVNSAIDNGDGDRCSDCKKHGTLCVRTSFVDEGLADVEYDRLSQEKRWKLTIRGE